MMKALALSAMAVTWLHAPSSASGEGLAPKLRAGAFVHAPVGQLASELDSGWGMRVSPVLALGPIALGISLETGAMGTPHPERDTDHLGIFGLGAAVEATLVQKRLVGVQAGAGYARRWLFGSGPVRRRCDDVGTCDGGYWFESPSYSMAGPFVSLVTTATAHRDRVRVGIAVETRVERPTIDLPGSGTVSGIALSTSVAFSLAMAQTAR